jgi:polysaccharide export outer membrane protein
MQPVRLGVLRLCFVTASLLAIMGLLPSARPQTSLETPQQTNDRIRALSSTVHMSPHDYVIGNGDVIVIDVFDVKELSREVRVSQTGSIGIPLVPVRLHVSGLTEVQAEQKIAEVLESNGLVSHPEVSVSVKERKSKPITIVGAVGHAMVYQADHPVTLLEVLAEAGGIANDAGDTVIVARPTTEPAAEPSEPPAIGPEDVEAATVSKDLTLTASARDSASASGAASTGSPTSKIALPAPSSTASPSDAPEPTGPSSQSNTITINLNQLVESGDATNNIILQAGDIVTVPHAGIVYILGAVARPGGFVLANDRAQMTTLKILALSGGLNPTAKKDHAFIIRKDNQGQQHQVPVDLKKVMDFTTEDVQLQPSDILYVPNSSAKAALRRAAEIGILVGTGVVVYRLLN